jgi:hypothetical protein
MHCCYIKQCLTRAQYPPSHLGAVVPAELHRCCERREPERPRVRRISAEKGLIRLVVQRGLVLRRAAVRAVIGVTALLRIEPEGRPALELPGQVKAMRSSSKTALGVRSLVLCAL